MTFKITMNYNLMKIKEANDYGYKKRAKKLY